MLILKTPICLSGISVVSMKKIHTYAFKKLYGCLQYAEAFTARLGYISAYHSPLHLKPNDALHMVVLAANGTIYITFICIEPSQELRLFSP